MEMVRSERIEGKVVTRSFRETGLGYNDKAATLLCYCNCTTATP